MQAPVVYTFPFLADADVLFVTLRDTLDWERRSDAPRHEYHCNDRGLPYTYGRGRGRRTYEARPYTAEILRIREAVERATSYRYEVCFLNRYLGQHDHLGWHADDSPEMDDDRPIVSVSLGAERAIQFRSNATGARDELLLQSGSMCSMLPGMQDTWQHRIPKTSGAVGERISLVFRGYIELTEEATS